MQFRTSSLISSHLSRLAVTRTAAALRPIAELDYARRTYRHRRRGAHTLAECAQTAPLAGAQQAIEHLKTALQRYRTVH